MGILPKSIISLLAIISGKEKYMSTGTLITFVPLMWMKMKLLTFLDS